MPHITNDNLYFTLDVKQAAQAGHDPSALSSAAGRLVNVHPAISSALQQRALSPPSVRASWISGRFADLEQAGYNGGVILEVCSRYKALPQLQRCFERVADCFSTTV